MNKLREMRLKKKIASKDMADKLGISVAFYSQIENKNRRLTYDMAVNIANIFKCKPDYIFYEEYKKEFENKLS